MTKSSRRKFLRNACLATAGAASAGTLGPLLGCAARRHRPAPPASAPARFFADLHAHAGLNRWLRRTPPAVQHPTLSRLPSSRFNPTSVDWKGSYEAGIDLVCAAHYNVFDEWLPAPTDPDPGAAARTHYMMDVLEEELRGEAAPYAKLAKSPDELRAMLEVEKSSDRFRVAVVHGLEGGHALGGNVDALDGFAARGVAYVVVVHFFNKGIATTGNAVPLFSDSGGRTRPSQGLSDFGEAVIRRMEELGMIVDVNHMSYTALEDAFRVARKPLLAAHSSARVLGDHAYSLQDEHIVEIVRGGGLIGVVLYPEMLSNFTTLDVARERGSLRDVVRSIRYMIKICGTHKHIGIGSDFEGYIVGPNDMRSLGEIGKLRLLLLEEFDNDERIVQDLMANNAIDFLLRNWRPGA